MRCGASDVLDAENGLMKNTTMFTTEIYYSNFEPDFTSETDLDN